MNNQNTPDNNNDRTTDILNEILDNYREINKLSENSDNNKFSYFLYWKRKESRLLKRELERPRKFYKKYKRGTLIRVDFGVNIGAEFSQIHYAIVLNKNDNRKNKILNVIPLTSKDKNNTLNIGTVVFNNYIKNTRRQLSKVKKENETEKKELKTAEDIEKQCKKLDKEIEKLDEIINYYSDNPIFSFACYKNITTINKTRILPEINEYDFINRTQCDSETMNKLDQKIIEYYTNFE